MEVAEFESCYVGTALEEERLTVASVLSGWGYQQSGSSESKYGSKP